MTYQMGFQPTPTSSTRRASGPTFSSSPKRSSPLSNPPVISQKPTVRPQPIPSTPQRYQHGHADPSTPSHASPSHPVTSTSPSPPLSRSHPLLGTYSLSLLHSRMSHAHAPHSISPTPTSGFSLHVGALGKGRSCPPELRCPPHEITPFSATYYDLEDSGRTTQSPWVGTVDLDQHYYNKYAPGAASTSSSSSTGLSDKGDAPPRYPGYRVAPVGQLQILIKTPGVPVKVFLVPYDLRKLPLGGRLLARERTYVQSPAKRQQAESPLPSPSSGVKSAPMAREKLRYSFQLQFHCVPLKETPSVSSRDGSTTRRTSRPVATESTRPPGSEEDGPAKDFYLSRSIRIVFASTPPERDDVTRTERQDEVVLPSEEVRESLLRGRIAPSPGSSLRRTSFGSSLEREDWDVVRQKWLARREVEKEMVVSKPPPLVMEPETRPATPPISLLSSHVLTPPSQSTALPVDPSTAPTFVPLAMLQPPRSVSPISGRSSPAPSSIRTPPTQRYSSNRGKKRRGSSSVEERELSERLRGMDVDREDRE